MSHYGKIIAPGTLRFERRLPAPAEKVWQFLVDSEKRGKWLAPGKTELFAGGKMELNFHHADLSRHHETIPEKYKDYEKGHGFVCQILQCEPFRIFSFTWADGSEVTIELTPQGNETLLVLTHRRLADNKNTRVSVASGWHTHLEILEACLIGKEPEGFWGMHSRMEKEYSERI